MSSQSGDSNHHPWKRTAWNAREAVSEALIALPDEYPRSQSVAVDEMHRLAEKYLFEYFSVFAPKRAEFESDGDEETELWDELLTTVHVPSDGQVRLPPDQSDLIKNGVSGAKIIQQLNGQLPTEALDIRLSTLEDDWQVNNTATIQIEGWVEHHGKTTKPIRLTRHLPVAGILKVREQLDQCLEEMGWLPQIDSTPRTEITEELIEEVEEWRQQNLE